jgi:uncharacterized membrane protein
VNETVRAISARTAFAAVLSVILVTGLTYTFLGPLSYYGGGPPLVLEARGLNGMSFLKASDPADYSAITWLRGHVVGTPTILEAPGPDYSSFGIVSTFTGLPTPLGWIGHEYQWRGSDPAIGKREQQVNTIYQTNSVAEAKQLLRKLKISLVYVGPCERQAYDDSSVVCDESVTSYGKGNLSKFRRFMRTVYHRSGVAIFEMPTADATT